MQGRGGAQRSSWRRGRRRRCRASWRDAGGQGAAGLRGGTWPGGQPCKRHSNPNTTLLCSLLYVFSRCSIILHVHCCCLHLFPAPRWVLHGLWEAAGELCLCCPACGLSGFGEDPTVLTSVPQCRVSHSAVVADGFPALDRGGTGSTVEDVTQHETAKGHVKSLTPKPSQMLTRSVSQWVLLAPG